MSELRPSPPTPAPADTRRPTDSAGRPLSWFARRRVAALDRASTRIHAGLLARAARGERPPASTGTSRSLVAISLFILATYAVAVVALVVATFASKSVVGWFFVVLAWLVVLAVAPRPHHLEDVRVLPAEDFPGTHGYVAAVADAVGTGKPDVVAVSSDLNAYVTRVGWGRRQALVLGLPFWTLMTDDERLALLGHELGHLRGRDTTLSHLVSVAHRILHRAATILTPLPADAYSDFVDYRHATSEALMNSAGSLVLRVLSVPPTLLLLLFERIAAVDSQRREYLADLRAAEVAGTAAMVRMLVTIENVPGLHTLAAAGVRRREDPFTVLETVRRRPAPTAEQVAAARRRAREQDLRWDASHPRDDLRLSLVEARAAEGSLAASDLQHQADVELARLRPELARRLADRLTETYYL